MVWPRVTKSHTIPVTVRPTSILPRFYLYLCYTLATTITSTMNNNNHHHRFKSLYLPHPQGAGALQNLHIRYLPIFTYHLIPFLSSPPTFCLFPSYRSLYLLPVKPNLHKTSFVHYQHLYHLSTLTTLPSLTTPCSLPLSYPQNKFYLHFVMYLLLIYVYSAPIPQKASSFCPTSPAFQPPKKHFPTS